MPSVHVLNGPNLNLLGTRQPELYGHETLADIEAMLHTLAHDLGVDLEFRQSNHEGILIDWIHEARERAAGIIINPAAFTHTSVAIMDALKTCTIPIVEVHISNVHQREDFRHRSYVSLSRERRPGRFRHPRLCAGASARRQTGADRHLIGTRQHRQSRLPTSPKPAASMDRWTLL